MKDFKLYLPAIISFGLASLYLFTASPSMLWLDASRFVAAMVTLGVSNPPEPLYVLLGFPFTKLPFGTMIFRIQLLSVLLAFCTLIATYILTTKILIKIIDKAVIKLRSTQQLVIVSGIFGLLTLGFSYQFWSQAQNIETFILDALILVITLILLLEISSRKNFFTNMSILAVLLGLASGTNPVIASVIPAVLFILWKHKKSLNPKRFFILAGLGSVAFIVIHLYIPWAALRNPFLNWGRATNLQGIIDVSTGAGLNVYVPELNRINGLTGSPAVFVTSIWHYIQILWINFTPVMLPFIFIGGLYLYLKNRDIFTVLISVVITNILLCGIYLSGNQESWFLMSYAVFAVFSGLAFYALLMEKSLLINYVIEKSKIVDQLHSLVLLIKANLENINIKKRQLKYAPWALFAVVFIPLWFWWPVLDRREWHLLEDYVNNLYKPLKTPAILFGSADLFDSMSFYVHDVVGECKDGSQKMLKRVQHDSDGESGCLGNGVIPVTDNILYMLKWYRDNLVASTGLKMPDDAHLEYNSANEYSKYVNDFIEMNMQNNHVYIDQPAMRNNFMSPGDKLPSLQIDLTKFDLIPVGMVYEVVRKESTQSAVKSADTTDKIDLSAFDFKFKTKQFPRRQPFLLEKVYKGELSGMINEYALSLEGLGDYYIKGNKADKAYEFYQKAYAFNPKNAEIVSRLGNFYGATGDARKAATFFKKAIDIEPENVGYKFNLAIAYLNMGQTKQAKSTFNEIIKDSSPTSTIAQQAKQQLAQLESLESGELQLPEGWKLYKNESLNLKFAYPEGFMVDESNDQVILTNKGKAKDNLTLIFYSQKMKDGDDLVKMESVSPHKMEGLLISTQPMNLLGFQSQIKMYANGQDLAMLVLLLRDNQGYTVKVSPGDSSMSKEFAGIMQSIRLVK